jgi:3-oxoacyl-[acyl-carrier-protein] synthase II
MIQSGSQKAIVTGGVDSMLNHLHFMGFYKLGALSSWQGEASQSCRPFDALRSGLVLGEGCALFLLENEKNAKKENILAEITGYSSTMDAFMVTDPVPDGKYLAQAALEAIAKSNIEPQDIDCVHAHGTGTIKNDTAECNALKLIFGASYTQVPVFSLKAQVGHLIGACGAIEVGGVLYSIKEQVVPPTLNFEYPDPDIPLKVLTRPLKKEIKYVLKLNAAFGGQNTALVIKKYE